MDNLPRINPIQISSYETSTSHPRWRTETYARRASRAYRVPNPEPTACQPGLSDPYQIGLSDVPSNIDIPLDSGGVSSNQSHLYLQSGTLRTHLQLCTRCWGQAQEEIFDHLHYVSNLLTAATICVFFTQSTRLWSLGTPNKVSLSLVAGACDRYALYRIPRSMK